MNKSWLDTIVEQHAESESPANYWRWSAMAALSAVVKDKIWMERYYYKLYPNIYVMLFGPSGIKKGPPVNLARKLVDAINNTRVINGRSSIQGILKKLGEAETKPGGYIVNTSCGFICSSEMASSVVEDKAFMTILTDVYDRNYRDGQWESLLKGESFKLKDVTVTLLGAVNQAHSDALFTATDINGGFFARTFFINETKPQRRNSLMYKPAIIPNIKELAEHLRALSQLSGEIKCTDEANEFMDTWYNNFWANIDSQGYEDPTGTINRYQDSVLKVAILMSLAKSTNLIVERAEIETAISYCERLIGNVRRATLGAGIALLGAQKKIAIMELVERNNHMISRTQLHKKFWMHGSLSEWNEIMEQLVIAGIIDAETMGNQLIYKMNDQQINGWQRHFEGK